MPGAAPATDHDEGSTRAVISGLNRTAFDLAVYASQGWLPTHHARLASGCWSSSTGRDWLPAGFHLKGFTVVTILLSRASWRGGQTDFEPLGPGRPGWSPTQVYPVARTRGYARLRDPEATDPRLRRLREATDPEATDPEATGAAPRSRRARRPTAPAPDRRRAWPRRGCGRGRPGPGAWPGRRRRRGGAGRAVSFSREGEAPAEPVRNLGEMKRLSRSLALPNPVKMRE